MKLHSHWSNAPGLCPWWLLYPCFYASLPTKGHIFVTHLWWSWCIHGGHFFLWCHSLYRMLADILHLLIFSECSVIPTNWNSDLLVIFRLQNHLCLSSFPDVLGHLLCRSSFRWFFVCAWICDVAAIWIRLLFSIHSIRYYLSFQHWFSHPLVCLIIVVVHFPTYCALWFLNHT